LIAEAATAPNQLLDLQAALEEMAHLSTVAETAAAKGPARVIQITGEIQAVLEEEPAREIPCLAPESRARFEVLRADCPRPWAQAVRKLRGRLIEERARREAAGRSLCSLAIVSPRRGGGRSTAARNLAASLAVLPDAKVLLMDADVERPSLPRRLGVPQAARLVDGGREFLRRVPDTGLHLLALGNSGANPLIDSLDHARLATYLQDARAHFTWVIVDAPPMETADGEALATMTDGLVMVLRAGREYFDEADAAVRRLDPTRLIGAILNSGR
jgi:receptor protein-tyrosine kinase